MPASRASTTLAIVAFVSLVAACGRDAAPPAAPASGEGSAPVAGEAAPDEAASAESPQGAAPELPEVDMTSIRAALRPDENAEVVTLGAAGTPGAASGTIDGAKTTVWVVPVAAGQTLTVSMVAQDPDVHFDVTEASDASGAAVHRGEDDGPDARITADAPTVYLIRPVQPSANARRGEKSDYALTISRG